MPRNQTLSDVLLLNFAVLCIATSGPLGRMVNLPPQVAIGWRALLAIPVLYVVVRLLRVKIRIKQRSDLAIVLFGGVLMAVHWVAYFFALQWSNVAIGMLSLFTYPVITALLEPLILKTRLQPIHLLLGGITLVGVYFLVPDIEGDGSHLPAVGMGVLSAFTFALRNVLMKRQVGRYHGSTLMFYQLIVIALVLLPFVYFQGTRGVLEAGPVLLALALLTTATGHTLLLLGFRHFSITTASLISSTQPLYGILLAAIFLKEYPLWTTYVGGGLILVSVVVESFRAGQKPQSSSSSS